MVEGPVSDSRDVVLARVRAALGTPPPSLPEIPRAYGRAVARPLVDLFCERAGEYRAAVRRVAPATLADAVAEATEGLDDDVALTGCTLAIATSLGLGHTSSVEPRGDHPPERRVVLMVAVDVDVVVGSWWL